jgi:hypothetical protein
MDPRPGGTLDLIYSTAVQLGSRRPEPPLPLSQHMHDTAHHRLDDHLESSAGRSQLKYGALDRVNECRVNAGTPHGLNGSWPGVVSRDFGKDGADVTVI